MSGIFAAGKALSNVYRQLGAHGSTSEALGDLMTFDQFRNAIGYEEKVRPVPSLSYASSMEEFLFP